MGKDVPQDKETAVKWLTLSAAQGNIYAQFFLDHMDSFSDPSVMLAATRLLHHAGKVFADNTPPAKSPVGHQVDRKLQRKIREKKMAQSHAKDDHEQTMESTGELLITILSSQAQEESRNMSENCHWGIVRQFENGVVRVNCKKFMGYTKDSDGNLVIVPEEAELVRRIFRLFLEGNSSIKIKQALEADKILTATGKTEWHPTVIDKMLSNEKYMGDALLQKTYTVDFLSKKKVINKGIVPQYYVEDDHEPIIPKELFYRVQEEKARRASVHVPATKRKEAGAKVKYRSTYVLSDIMACGECGHPYRRQVWSKYGAKKAVWRCDSRLKNGTKMCRHSPTLNENTLHEAVMTAINSVVEDQSEFVEAFRENVIRVIGSYQTAGASTKYDEQLESLQRQMMTLIEDSAKTECADEDFDQKYRVIADEIKELKKKKRKQLRENNWQMSTSRGWRVWTAT